jgi:hypothetical protein
VLPPTAAQCKRGCTVAVPGTREVVRNHAGWAVTMEGAVCFVNPRPERARSALCAPLQGAPSRRARAVSPGNPLRARYVGYGEARGETEESVLMERRSGEAAVGYGGGQAVPVRLRVCASRRLVVRP